MSIYNPIVKCVLDIRPRILILTIERKGAPVNYYCFPESEKYNPIERHRRMRKFTTRTLQHTQNEINRIVIHGRRT